MPFPYSNLQATSPSGLWVNATGSALVVTGRGALVGVLINSNSSGTLKIYDSLTATGSVIMNTMSFASTEHFIPLFGARFNLGVYLAIGGTLDMTLVYNV